MKRYFVGCTIASLLALSSVSSARNLELVLDGPFLVCENVGTKTLTIAVPNLEGTHYVPGFVSELGYLPLGTDGKGALFGPKYHLAADGVQSVISWTDSKRRNRHMVLKPERKAAQKPAAYFYSEKGGCSNQDKSLVSYKFTVPVPDEVWALNPTEGRIFITDQNDVSSYKGECDKNDSGCNYSTRLVLRYKQVNLKTLKIDTQCNATTCTMNDHWVPNSSADLGSEFEIELSAEPMPSDDERAHEKRAFKAASTLSGVHRDLNFPARSPLSPVLHKLCQVPPVFLCTSYTSGKACPTN
jgi:hypothetical protein